MVLCIEQQIGEAFASNPWFTLCVMCLVSIVVYVAFGFECDQNVCAHLMNTDHIVLSDCDYIDSFNYVTNTGKIFVNTKQE